MKILAALTAFYLLCIPPNQAQSLVQQLGYPEDTKLLILHAASTLDDLKVPPGNRLEKLKGDRKRQYSIRINDQWRVCFRWKGGDAYDVEIVDYH